MKLLIDNDKIYKIALDKVGKMKSDKKIPCKVKKREVEKRKPIRFC